MAAEGRWTRWMATLGFVTCAISAPLEAQGYFGQNQVQYDRLRWRVIETEHFLVHYYPEIADVAPDAARMAERSYARLSRLMQHQFREKKPILLFGSVGDFAQSNVFGDLGEGTGGVTDPLRQRMAQFFTGDWGSFEHVLQHEMVHVFQFDIFSRGRAGAGLQNLAMVNPPLWFMEGLAEYFSIGRTHPWTASWARDAVVNNTLPTIRQMTERPDRYFPYRYGLSVWQFVGERWGDEVIGEIMNAIPSLGIDRAFKREIGLNTDELSNEWKEYLQSKYLPVVAGYDRPRKFAEPLLSQRRSGSVANLFVAPALSNDGKLITYIAYGSLLRGEVFPDLYLANAETGKRIARLIKTTTNPDFEQLRFIYSQPSFSPDGKYVAFTGQRGGRDVLYLLDVNSRKVVRSFDFELDQVLSPSFSPDGQHIVFSGMKHGTSDLYITPIAGGAHRQLTRDSYGDLQPQWSPDGRTIAFASDRGSDTDFDILKIGKWRVSLLDLETGNVTVVPGQEGLSINPQWAPDGRSIAYVSDRTGIANLFLYDLTDREHYQLTNVVGSITAVAEYSPAITWARGADVLAFVYFERSEHSIWKIKNPRALKGAPFRSTTAVVAQTPADSLRSRGDTLRGTSTVVSAQSDPLAYLRAGTVRDTSASRQSFYRSPITGARASSDLPNVPIARSSEAISVTSMLSSYDFNLPDTTRFREYRYKARFSPEYIAQPSIGYGQNAFGQGTYGGTMIILSDLLGDHRLALAGSINGQLSDAQVFAGYTNYARRLQYTTGVTQQPFYLLSNVVFDPIEGSDVLFEQRQNIYRLVQRSVFATALYPLNRFERFELGARFLNVDQQVFPYSRTINAAGNYALSDFQRGPTQNIASANTVSPYLAYVTDNTLFGFTGPISGKRMRLEFQPSVGTWQWNEYLADARGYVPILFNYVTFATRFVSSLSVGRDEQRFPKWIGRPDFIRGYNREVQGSGVSCSGIDGAGCNQIESIGSRVAFANAELRFPVIRHFDFGILPIGLPPVDGLVFYDAGIAWSKGQSISLKRDANYDYLTQRSLLTSYGFGFRMNLFNIAIIRWDYAIPTATPNRQGFGTWFFGASY